MWWRQEITKVKRAIVTFYSTITTITIIFTISIGVNRCKILILQMIISITVTCRRFHVLLNGIYWPFFVFVSFIWWKCDTTHHKRTQQRRWTRHRCHTYSIFLHLGYQLRTHISYTRSTTRSHERHTSSTFQQLHQLITRRTLIVFAIMN